MESLLGMKELYDVVLKATYPIEVLNRTIEEGEVIARFDNILIANFQEIKSRVAATGGYDNRGWVFWEDTKEVKINFSQGIFSKTQLGLLANAKLISTLSNTPIEISMQEIINVDENNNFTLKHTPTGPIFVYDKNSGQKLKFTTNNNVYHVSEGNEVIVDYVYKYMGGASAMTIGQGLVSGFLTLEGKTRLKDDTTGQVVTGIIKIPKLKLMSDLSIRLGKEAIPTIANFSAVGLPTGSKGRKKVMEFIVLNDDIDADI